MFTYSFADLLGQVRSQPPLLQFWLATLIFVTVIWPAFLIRHRAVRIFWRWQWANLIIGGALMQAYGLSRIVSLSHLLFWTPALIYLIRVQWQVHAPASRLWMMTAIVVMGISLVFDTRDFLAYLNGATGLIGTDH